MYQHRSNMSKHADIVRALAQDPSRSNLSIARELGVGECAVRRHRFALEQASLIANSSVRRGGDGKAYDLPTFEAHAQ